MALSFLSAGEPLLDDRFPLPLDEPFTRAAAQAHGIGSNDLTRLIRLGLVRRLIENVYAVAQLVDSLEVRVAALRLVVPPGAVVTDRTAGWLHGAQNILAPGDHLVVPRLSIFHRTRGCRLRTDLTASGQRMMPDEHIMDVRGILVTNPLRTTCDLGRLLHRDAAFAALDSMLRLGLFAHEELLEWAKGFRGYRHVRQLRALAPLADARAQSPPESILRLRWLDCTDLPGPSRNARCGLRPGSRKSITTSTSGSMRFASRSSTTASSSTERIDTSTTPRDGSGSATTSTGSWRWYAGRICSVLIATSSGSCGPAYGGRGLGCTRP
jgi:hypothetical protein